METHIANFLDCVRTRQKPTLNVDVALRAQVTISHGRAVLPGRPRSLLGRQGDEGYAKPPKA